MGIDRFVHWKKAAPSQKEVMTVLTDFLGGAANEVSSSGRRITAVLVGKPSYPFKHITDYEKYTASAEQRGERFIEVYWTRKKIDIITRQTDEFTNVVADGFSMLAARFWGGIVEDH